MHLFLREWNYSNNIIRGYKFICLFISVYFISVLYKLEGTLQLPFAETVVFV